MKNLRTHSIFTMLSALSIAALIGVRGAAPWPAVRAIVVMAVGWVLTRQQSRSGERGSSLTAVASGLASLVFGLGIGVPYVIHAGPSVGAACGAVTLLCGAVLVCSGMTSLLRGLARPRKAAALAGAVMATWAVVFPITLTVFVTNVPPLRSGHRTPSDVGLSYESVELWTTDRVRLGAWYVPSTNGAAVVLLAGATGVRSDELDHAAVIARHGFGVLLLDVRGRGASAGHAMLWGWYGNADIRPAIDYLAARPDVARGRIGVIGMSMGAEEAIGAAGDDQRIRAVVAEGASGRGVRDEGDTARGVDGVITRYLDWVTSHLADVISSARTPAKLGDSIENATSAKVFVIAAGTRPTEIAAAGVFKRRAPQRVSVWVAPGAGHTHAFDHYPDEWERRVTSFLSEAFRESNGVARS